ncbi:hypothetical protein HRbin08_00106 [bacterium HR08]|nr:hypothetical protein HRbin08_00106 [bacterium HR08]
MRRRMWPIATVAVLVLTLSVPIRSKTQWYGEGGCGYWCTGEWMCDPENCWSQWCVRSPYPQSNCHPNGGPFEGYCCDNDGNCDQVVDIYVCAAAPSCRPPQEEGGWALSRMP